MLGFICPYSGSKNQFMIYENFRLTIPSNEEYSISQVKMKLKEIEQILSIKIDSNDWMIL